MKIPDCAQFGLNNGVLPEPGTAAGRIVLWRPGSRENDGQLWERIANVAGAAVTAEQGLCATPAMSISARQPLRGFFGKLWQRVRETPGERSWVLPSGESAEQTGDKRTDLLLVWSTDEAVPLDEARLRERWPAGNRFEPIGRNLFLVGGIAQDKKDETPAPAPFEGQPSEQAQKLLIAARQSGDRSREASALADLGITSLRVDDPSRAIKHLEEALALVRSLNDRAREADILGNLGLAYIHGRQVPQARESFERELTLARETGNRIQEKLALEHQGHLASALRDPAGALGFYDKALVIAREVGDWHHEADLIWHQAIQYADVGQREDALSHGQTAIDLLRKKGSPEAVSLTDHLHKYRLGEAGLSPNPAAMGGSVVAGTWATATPPGQAVSGPGLLRMGLSVAKSMAKFVGGGLKVLGDDAAQRRLRTCATCEHHTGMRCRVCGCFTSVKAKMAHEACPLGKWPL